MDLDLHGRLACRWGPINPLETLRGLDAMRTSKEINIVELAETLYGV